MKSILLGVLLCLAEGILADQENCVEQPSDPCASLTEYTAYISCLTENKRQKRSAGCPLLNQVESCEYVDCQNCQDSCLPDCPDCECSSACRQCCSETCTTNLCCHKTCHNQCKTNYCRAECKKDCKERINSQPIISGSDTDLDVNVRENVVVNNSARHNITTIINLQNIINNTNLIDIPIKINNTNFNNITLKRSDQMSLNSQYGQLRQQPETDPKTGEKCCYIVSPRQCVKTNYYPFMKCFHYRHRKCGPYCIATIIHAQNQNYCDESGCHNKIFYVPQVQPKCYYSPNSPFVNCGGQQTFHNCQGCYDHVTSGTQTSGIHHHMRCSRCYDNNAGPAVPQMAQPPMMPNYPMGMGYPMPYPMGYPGGGYYPGYPPAPMYQPGYPQNPNSIYGQGQQFYGQGQQFYGQGQQIYGQGQQFYGDNTMDNDIVETKSNFNEIDSVYPVGNSVPYVHEVVIQADKLLKSGSTDDIENKTIVQEETSTRASKYALISIDAQKSSNHHKREEKRSRRKKSKHEHEHTTERKRERDESTTEKKT